MSCVKNTRLIVAAVIVFFITGMFYHDAPMASAIPLTDLQSHWAKQAVTRAAALDLISGYSDGQFKPEQEISQIEALVLFMRAEGFSFDKKTTQKKSSPVSQQVKTPKIPWGQNYLDAAAENQFLSTEDVASFSPQASATRAQVATLLSRILQLPVASQSSDGSGSTTFSDLTSTPPAYLPYVRAITDAGIMSGYQDGTFGPNLGLKRCEAATLLSKLIDQGWAKISSDRQLVGWVKQISQKKGTLEMELVSLQGSQIIKLDANVQCFKGLRTCLPQEILDYQVEVLLNSKKQAAYISLLESRNKTVADQQITGTIKSVALGIDSLLVLNDLHWNEKKLPLSWDAVIDGTKKATSTKGFQSLKPGTFVTVLLAKGKIIKVTLLDTVTVSGIIQNLTSKRLTLDDKGSAKGKWFNIWDWFQIVDKDKKRMDEVLRGDKIKITFLDPQPDTMDNETILEIMVTARPKPKKISGDVQSSSGTRGAYQITLKKDKVYQVDSTAIIYLDDGTKTTFSNIRAGDKVEMQVDGAGVVMSATIVLKKVTGVVQAISGSVGAYQITLVQDKVYNIDPTALIYKADGTTTTFGTIQVGDKVEFGVDGSNVALKVTIVTPSTP